MPVHVLGGGMGHDIGAPLDGTAVDGSGKGVVDDQRHPVSMSRIGKPLNIQNIQGRIGNGLPEHRLGVGLEGRLQLLVGAIGGNKGKIDAHPLHGHGKEIKGAAVNGRAGHHMIPDPRNVENREEGGRLPGTGQHGGRAALQLADLGRNGVAGGILQTGIKIAAGLQIKQLAHIFAGSILKGRALNNGNLTGLAVPGGVAPLHAFCFDLKITHGKFSFLKRKRLKAKALRRKNPRYHSSCVKPTPLHRLNAAPAGTPYLSNVPTREP